MKIYLANGLFSQADRDFNLKIATAISNSKIDIDLYVPQLNMRINNKSHVVVSTDIAIADYNELIKSDIMIAVIDGVEIDSGVAAEIGIAFARGIPVFALCTDIRFNVDALETKMGITEMDVFENSIMYRNLFVTGIIKLSGGVICSNIDDLIKAIKK